jgi:D-psicose/D-tagatose/L-ribulose 3-epimerase
VRRTDAGGTTTVIGSIPVYAHDEDGLQGIGTDRGTPGADHFDWPRFLAGLATTGYGGAVCIESFTAQNEAIATAASIWRSLAPSQDTLARDGLSYLRTVLRGLENAPLTG